MSQDQNKKTLRSFQSRDYLWEIFERMSGELECSADYLINEAMRQYARSRNYGIPGTTTPGISRAPVTAAEPAVAPVASPTAPPPPPAAPEPVAAASVDGQRPPLFIIFNGQKIPVSKESFVVGRSSKSADLAIKDGNISRRHAEIVFQDGNYSMRDLGSTNGVEYAGQRIDSQVIEEGDIFQICDYSLQFTYY